MNLSLQFRILIALGIITAASLLIVWMVVRPQYETSAMTDRLTIVQQLQNYSIENLDRTIVSWSEISQFIASQVTDHPKEGESILHTMMALHSDIIQIKIHSQNLSDELTSQNTSYPALNLEINDTMWVRSKLDSVLQIAWLLRTESPQQLLVMQTRCLVQNTPFILTVIWNARQLNDILARLPLGQNYSMSIHSSSSMIVRNGSSFAIAEEPHVIDKVKSLPIVQDGATSWRVLTGAFQSVQLWMMVAFPEKTITKPVEDLMFSFTWLIVGPMLIVSIFGWAASRQMSRLIHKMKTEMVHNSNQ
jgi:hypothetical protein